MQTGLRLIVAVGEHDLRNTRSAPAARLRRLDEPARDRIEGLVKDLNRREGLTFVIVSHYLGQVERMADRVILVDAGRVTGEWSREEFDGGGSEKVRRLVSERP